MHLEMTIFGFFVRQTAALSVLVLSAWLCATAHAAPTSNSTSNQTLIIQGSGALEPAPSNWGPNAGPYSANRTAGNGSEIWLWPGMVSYNRVVEFSKPYLQTDLHLGIDYTYTFNFQLRARDAESHMPQVPDGWYELDVAVVLPNVRSTYMKSASGRDSLSAYERFVTSRSMLVQVAGGLANRQITLRFPNLSATTVASHLYISFTPIEKNCVQAKGRTAACVQLDSNGKPDLSRSKVVKLAGYKAFSLDIPFVPYIPAGSGTGNPDDALASPNPDTDPTLPAYIASAKAYQAAQATNRPARVLTPQQFAAQQGLVYLSANDKGLSDGVKYWQVDDEWRAQLTELFRDNSIGTVDLKFKESSLWSALCAGLVMNNQKALTDLRSTNPQYYSMTSTQTYINMCSYQAQAVFRMTVVDHVYRFDSANVTIDAMQPLRYSLSTSFMVSRNHSRDSSSSFSVTDLLFKAFDAFGIPLRALGLSHSVSVSDGQSSNESTSGSVSSFLDFNVMPMHIPVTRGQRCLEVRPVANNQLPFYNNLPSAKTNGLYICEDVRTTTRSLGEVYAHVFTHSGDTSLVDSYSPLAQMVNIAMQGDRDISTFFALTRQSLTPVHNSRILPTDMLQKSRNYFASSPVSQPGLIVRPVRYYKDDAPSFTEMVFGSYRENFVGQN